MCQSAVHQSATIILWNIVYLQNAVQMLAEQGTPVPPECLSPLGWEHINMTGDYVWNLRQTTTIEKLRPLCRHKLPPSEALAYSQEATGGANRPLAYTF